MRRTTATRQRGKKIILLLLLLPLVGLFLWGGMALTSAAPTGDGAAERGVSGTALTALVESSTLQRNNIYDRNFDLLALSFRLGSLYARPLEIGAPAAAADRLAEVLGLEQEQLLDSFRSERSFVWLARQVEHEMVEAVLALGLPGVYAMPHAQRYYPMHAEAAHAVGFVKDQQGLAGIELSYDNILRGGVGDIRLAAAGVPEGVAAAGGVHLVSTLDLPFQRELEQRLARVLRAVDGQAASGLVMDVTSGAVVAMVSLPGYDPNRFWQAGPQERLNRAVAPGAGAGALQEIFRLAAAADPALAGRPRQAKAEREQADEPATQFWHPLADGVYASASLAPKPGRAVLPDGEFQDFLRLAGLCQPSDLDLLEGRSLVEAMRITGRQEDDCQPLLADYRAKVSGVSLLAAFSRLMSQGRPVEPHLIRGFWDGEQFWARKSAIPGESLPLATAQAALTALGERADGSVASYESLVMQQSSDPFVPRDEAAPGEIDKTAATGTAANKKAGEKPDGALVVAEPAPPGTPRPAPQAEEPPAAPPRYQATLLAMAPADNPTLAALLLVDQAQLDLALPSPLAGVVRDLDTWGTSLQRLPGPPEPAAVMARESDLYRQWLGMREKGELQVHAAVGRPPERMPDVVGLSLRQALQVLQTSGLRLQVRGSGRVVAQQPLPGTSLRGIDEGVVELSVPGGELAAAQL